MSHAVSDKGIVSGGSRKRVGKVGTASKPSEAFWNNKSLKLFISWPRNGKRTGHLIINMEDASEIPAIAEPWFLAFNAEVEATPVMIPADLEKAGPAIALAVKTYG